MICGIVVGARIAPKLPGRRRTPAAAQQRCKTWRLRFTAAARTP